MNLYGLSLIEPSDRFAVIAPAPLDSYFVIGVYEVPDSPEVLGWVELIPGWTVSKLIDVIYDMREGLEEQRELSVRGVPSV